MGFFSDLNIDMIAKLQVFIKGNTFKTPPNFRQTPTTFYLPIDRNTQAE